IPVFSALNNNWQRAFQVNYTHNFSPTTLNEAIFGANRVEGVLGSGAKDYSVPSIAVQGISTEAGQAFGVGFAQGDFFQHNSHWRDVLTHRSEERRVGKEFRCTLLTTVERKRHGQEYVE